MFVLSSTLLVFILLASGKWGTCQKKESSLLIHVKENKFKVKRRSQVKLEAELMNYNKDTIQIPFYFRTIDNKAEELLFVDFMAQYKENGKKEYNSYNNQINYSASVTRHYSPVIFLTAKKLAITYIHTGLLEDPGKYKIRLVLTYYIGSNNKLKQVTYSNWIYITVK